MNFNYKKSLGQNFLKDENIINKIVSSSSIDKDTLVIEVGPGAGSLSKKIIPLSGFSLLYEIDLRLESILNSTLGCNNNYKVIFNDVLKQNIRQDISDYNYKKVFLVANLPYYITTPIITKFIKEIYPDKILVMVQDEVADRFVSRPSSKDYGMITVLLNSKYSIKKLFKVSKNCFEPIPKVDSAIVCFDKRGTVIKDEDFFERFIKDAFKFKRKNLKNNLKSYDLSLIENILVKYGFSLSSRAEDIPVDIFIEIVNKLKY